MRFSDESWNYPHRSDKYAHKPTHSIYLKAKIKLLQKAARCINIVSGNLDTTPLDKTISIFAVIQIYQGQHMHQNNHTHYIECWQSHSHSDPPLRASEIIKSEVSSTVRTIEHNLQR